jgi:hypothetical protein
MVLLTVSEIETAKKSGWFYAGGFYWGIKSINEETHNLLA